MDALVTAAYRNGYVEKYGEEAARRTIADGVAYASPRPEPGSWDSRPVKHSWSGGQWVKGKSCDSFAPFGPFMATPDEIKDFNNLKMVLKVNGEPRQNGSTSYFIFQIPKLINYLSHMMTLLPGDIVSTGTPPGVGFAMKPPQFIKAGDVIEWSIEGLGSAKQTAVQA